MFGEARRFIAFDFRDQLSVRGSQTNARPSTEVLFQEASSPIEVSLRCLSLTLRRHAVFNLRTH